MLLYLNGIKPRPLTYHIHNKKEIKQYVLENKNIRNRFVIRQMHFVYKLPFGQNPITYIPSYTFPPPPSPIEKQEEYCIDNSKHMIEMSEAYFDYSEVYPDFSENYPDISEISSTKPSTVYCDISNIYPEESIFEYILENQLIENPSIV
jgi:hypothetical protein